MEFRQPREGTTSGKRHRSSPVKKVEFNIGLKMGDFGYFAEGNHFEEAASFVRKR